MRDLIESGFVIEDSCSFTFAEKWFLLTGQIICLAGLIIEVEKRVGILSGKGPSARVKTQSFTYHTWIRGGNNIFRYCSADPPHRPNPHKHIFEPFDGGKESNVIELVDEEDIPTLGEVIVELRDWHAENFVQLLEQPGG